MTTRAKYDAPGLDEIREAVLQLYLRSMRIQYRGVYAASGAGYDARGPEEVTFQQLAEHLGVGDRRLRDIITPTDEHTGSRHLHEGLRGDIVYSPAQSRGWGGMKPASFRPATNLITERLALAFALAGEENQG